MSDKGQSIHQDATVMRHNSRMCACRAGAEALPSGLPESIDILQAEVKKHLSG